MYEYSPTIQVLCLKNQITDPVEIPIFQENCVEFSFRKEDVDPLLSQFLSFILETIRDNFIPLGLESRRMYSPIFSPLFGRSISPSDHITIFGHSISTNKDEKNYFSEAVNIILQENMMK